MPEFPYSLKGRVIHGRSQPGYDVRIKDEPWQRQQAVYYNHVTGPPGCTHCGQALTEEERRVKHYGTYGTTQLPPRGTGLQRGMVAVGGRQVGIPSLTWDWNSFIIGGVLTLIFGYFVFTSSGRKIGYAAGRRIAKKI